MIEYVVTKYDFNIFNEYDKRLLNAAICWVKENKGNIMKRLDVLPEYFNPDDYPEIEAEPEVIPFS